MKQDVKVSVILPIYNVESCLAECLDTLIAQSLEEIEIICVNDGSTDGSLAILEEKAKIDSRIQIISQENSGAAVARNHGFTYATGEYVLFLDSDDFFHRDMLKKAYECAKTKQTDVVIFRGRKYDTITHKYYPMEFSIKRESLPDKNPFTYHDIPDHIFTFAVGWAWDKLYKRQFIMESGLKFQELRTSNDLFFVFSSFIKANAIYVLDEYLIYHRVNRNTSLSVTREKSWDCFYKATMALKNELVSMGVYEEVERGFLNWVIDFAFWNLNTIIGKAYENVYMITKETLFPELGMDKKSAEYYFNQEHYKKMCEIMETDFKDYLLVHMLEYRTKMKLMGEEREELRKEKDELKKELNEIKEELKWIKRSTTFRVGKRVMAIPIKVKKMIKGEK